MPFKEAAEIFKKGDYPRCPKCNQILKPAITFFGESLPIDAMRAAEAEASSSDLMLVLGTSLTVYPAAALPGTAQRSGAEIVIINNMPTPLDNMAVIKMDELEPVFTALSALL
jgi:NAD-dependent deacetylase